MNQRENEKTPISSQSVRQEETQGAKKETDESEQFFKAEIEKLEQDKTKLIEELNQINNSNNYHSILLNKSEIQKKYSGLNKNYQKAGLFFPEEFSVNPVQFIHKVLVYLTSFNNFSYFPNTLIKKTKLNFKILNDMIS